LNAGLARARATRILLVNADVVVLPGALSALLDAVDPPSVGAAAPLAFWDADSRLRLPAGDPPRFLVEFARGFRGPDAASERRFASLARETLRLWQAGGTTRHLVGALLATRRDVLDRVGRLDERFPFEYEETEWEDRVRRAGLELRFTPRARVRHRWGVSSSRNSETPGRREASRRLYRELRWGRAGRRLLEWADARPAVLPASRPVAVPEVAARAGAWLAFSPNPSCFPFAGTPLSADFRLPEEIERTLPRGAWYLRVFRESDGQPLETLRWEAAA
jgi:GT2 family glycosyltransferase